MRNRPFVLSLVALGMLIPGPLAAGSNLGSPEATVFQGHHITPDAGGPRVLYAPSESDDAGYRNRIAAHIGGTCDYYDARHGTPGIGLLDAYDGVVTWVNYEYQNNVAFGNNLADFVDHGGRVILGAFCVYTSGSFLAGRVMTDHRYCPVTGGFNHWSLSFWDGSDATHCLHDGVASYGCTYRDYLTVVGQGATYIGLFSDGEFANVGNGSSNVLYANGAGGYPLFPSGQDAERVANAVVCGMIGWGGHSLTSVPGFASTSVTWGAIKGLFQ